MTSITVDQAREAAAQLNRDIYAAISTRLTAFEKETGLQPCAINISMTPFNGSFELDTVYCQVYLY